MKKKQKKIPSKYALFVVMLFLSGVGFSIWSGQLIFEYYRGFFPETAVLKTWYPVAIKKVGRKTEYRFQKEKPKEWVALNAMPRHVMAAILAAEDATFFQHKGYSPEAIRAAIEHNIQTGVKIKRGGSTITQQVVKNLFLSPEKTLVRKGRELFLAVDLERNVSKSRILETYFNIVEWGPEIYGIKEASSHYFGTNPANLTPRQAATLAFLLPNPKRYQSSISGGQETAFAKQRIESILEHMWKNGSLTDEEYASSVSLDTLQL